MIRHESCVSFRIFLHKKSEKRDFDRRRVLRASTVLAKVAREWRNIEHCKLASTQNHSL